MLRLYHYRNLYWFRYFFSAIKPIALSMVSTSFFYLVLLVPLVSTTSLVLITMLLATGPSRSWEDITSWTVIWLRPSDFVLYSMFGDVREMELHYFLADDTVEICERIPNNSGRDAVPMFLRRQKLPKVGQFFDLLLIFRFKENTSFCHYIEVVPF